jgi:hypothetical protein
MFPSPSLGPPLLSESMSPPLFCGIPPPPVVVGGGGAECVVVVGGGDECVVVGGGDECVVIGGGEEWTVVVVGGDAAGVVVMDGVAFAAALAPRLAVVAVCFRGTRCVLRCGYVRGLAAAEVVVVAGGVAGAAAAWVVLEEGVFDPHPAATSDTTTRAVAREKICLGRISQIEDALDADSFPGPISILAHGANCRAHSA